MARKQKATVAASNLAKHRWSNMSKGERTRASKNATDAMNNVSHEKKSAAAKKAHATKRRKG